MLVYPLNLLPWTWFVAAWTAILIGAVWVLTGRDLFLLGMAVGAMEIAGGNISLLLTVAIVWGFRWPWTWAFVLLTKITPGVGLLWFAVRREWRSLGIALGATAAIVAVSFVLMPHNWFAWFDLLAANTGKGGTWASIPIPLLIRGPIGVALIVWGALRNQRWTVPVGAMLALPALWYGSLSMLLGRDPAHDTRRTRPRVGPHPRVRAARGTRPRGVSPGPRGASAHGVRGLAFDARTRVTGCVDRAPRRSTRAPQHPSWLRTARAVRADTCAETCTECVAPTPVHAQVSGR